MKHFIPRIALVCGVALTAAGCATARGTTAAPGPRSACALVAAGAAAPDSVAIAAATTIDPSRVPVPSNATERFVFAQLYETLINVDCEGRPYPGLAKSWLVDATRTRVTFVIRDGARFWNGKPVEAADVVTAWRSTGGQSSDASRLARRMADATTIVDDRTMTVSLPDTSWRVLADPALSVFQQQSGSTWAGGTGPYHVAVPEAGHEPRRLALEPQSAGPILVLQPTRSNDARDAIDRGVDVLVTDDPIALAYVDSRPGFASVPLPWTRTYVLAIPSVTGPDSSLLRHASGDSSALFRESLAHDAVRVEARAAEPPYWWTDIQSCGSAGARGMGQRTTGRRPARIAYDGRDRVARRLAERLVALGGGVTAAPLAPDAFTRSLRDGSESAYVIALPRVSLDFCDDAGRLVAAAPWTIAPPGESPAPASPTIIPLVDTRDRAAVNRDRVSASIDWDGTLRFVSPSRAP